MRWIEFTEDEKIAFLKRKGYTIVKRTYIQRRPHVLRDDGNSDYQEWRDDELTDKFAFKGEEPSDIGKHLELLLRLTFERVLKECIVNNL
jgi:hypothetical protein